MHALQELVVARYAALDSVPDAELRDEVRSVADVILDTDVFHALHRVVVGSISPPEAAQWLQTPGPPAWLLTAVGDANHAKLREADALMKQLATANFELIAGLIAMREEAPPPEDPDAANAAANAFFEMVRREPLWFMADRRLPRVVRDAMLARFRVEVFSVLVLSSPAFDVAPRALAVVLDEWTESARTHLAYLTGFPGVSKRAGIVPMDLDAIQAEHRRTTDAMEAAREGRRAKSRSHLN